MRRLSTLIGALSSLTLLLVASVMPVSAEPAAAPLATSVEWSVLEMVNAERLSHGLERVEYDEAALQVARDRAAAQVHETTLTHYDSNGNLGFVILLADYGVEYSLAGENLARGPRSDPATLARIHQALMNSPTHRKNILQPSFNRLAVGAVTDESGRLVFAQIFRAAP